MLTHEAEDEMIRKGDYCGKCHEFVSVHEEPRPISSEGKVYHFKCFKEVVRPRSREEMKALLRSVQKGVI